MLRTRSLALVALLLTFSPVQASRLSDLVEEAGFGWMIGAWEATDQEGNKTTVTYQWVLDKNAVRMEYQREAMQSTGLIFLRAADQQVAEVTVDSRGGTWMGTWSAQEGNPVAIGEYTGPDGQKVRAGLMLKQVNADTVKVEFYPQASQNAVQGDPTFTAELKRRK